MRKKTVFLILICFTLIQCHSPSQNGKKQSDKIEAQRNMNDFKRTPATGFTDARKLFDSSCKSCHHRDLRKTGPALRGVRERWEDCPSLIYAWVRNWENVVDTCEYAREIAQGEGLCKTFPNMTTQEIDAIFDYMDGYAMEEMP